MLLRHFSKSEVTIFSHEQRLERKAREALGDLPCTLIINGQRRAGRLQQHFKYLNWNHVLDMPNYEVEVRGLNSGRVIKVDMAKAKLHLHANLQDAIKEQNDANTKNATRPT